MIAYIGDIAESAPCLSINALSKQAHEIFRKNSKVHGIVLTNGDIPVSLITRTHFFQKMGSLYGYNLYMGRSIDLIANKDSLIVDYYQSIAEVSKLAMERDEEDRYSYVIVTKDQKYIGVVSIQNLLLKLVEVQVEFASFLNPLTMLPGNHIIDEKLQEALRLEQFTVMYFDLDHFKAYNDTYGFKKGDDLIISTSERIKVIVEKYGGFLGHIGGDDFIAVLNHYDYQCICEEVINYFNMNIERFYNSKHLSQRYVMTEDRQGIVTKIPLVSLSIAVVTNGYQQFLNVEELVETAAVIKRRCKMIEGSCYLDNSVEYQF